jgi:dihydrofolate reductase
MHAPSGPDADRSGGFVLGGWLVPMADGDMAEIVVEWISRAGGFLLGGGTYEPFAAHWPLATAGDPVARALDTLPEYVASHTFETPAWGPATVLRDVVRDVAVPKRRPGDEIHVHGSPGLPQTLMQHDLVDEYRLWFFPVVRDRGKRRFGSGAVATALRLADGRSTRAGAVIHTCQRAGAIRHGLVEAATWREDVRRQSARPDTGR